ncbi:unnamed protein product [Nippostrongylus brasiliensis]|uniref:Uncharacterized protein n=1 Tax=Nippostrongylus brasiliensis TaxID=27835 RepID=A0A0N4XL87_NIPBR|nr:unnamed protein product [Nippostrongylus brasiliensis]
MVGDLEKAPPPPVDAPPAPQLPYWFTTECRNNLVNCDVPAMSVPSAPSPIPPPLPMPDLKQQLKAQLEYYFSRWVFSESHASKFCDFLEYSTLVCDYSIFASELNCNSNKKEK